MTNFAQYVGGSGRANPKLSPIDIGVINQQGGSADVAPEWTTGATLAAEFINDDAGGIDGHPVRLVQCFIPDTVSSAASCGQEMADNSHVLAVSVGPVTIGNQAMESALAPTHKLLVWGVATGASDVVYKSGYILFGDSSHVEAPWANFFKNYLKVHSVSIVWPDEPGESVDADIVVDALHYVGIKTVYSVSFDPSDTDLVTPLEAAHVGQTGAFLADGDSTQCADMYEAMKQLNITTKVAANVPCASAQTATADGGNLPPNWYYAAAGSMPGDKGDPGPIAFRKIAAQFHLLSWWQDSWVKSSFSGMITIAKWYNEVLTSHKTPSTTTLNGVAKAFTGPVALGPQKIDCGQFADAPAVCNDTIQFFQNTAPNVMTSIVRWLPPPKGYEIPKGLE